MESYRDSGMAVIHWGIISGKFPNSVSKLHHEPLCMEQQWCGNTQISFHPQKFQHLNTLQNQDTKMMSVSRAAKRD
jgi:hypothetical protein